MSGAGRACPAGLPPGTGGAAPDMNLQSLVFSKTVNDPNRYLLLAYLELLALVFHRLVAVGLDLLNFRVNPEQKFPLKSAFE